MSRHTTNPSGWLYLSWGCTVTAALKGVSLTRTWIPFWKTNHPGALHSQHGYEPGSTKNGRFPKRKSAHFYFRKQGIPCTASCTKQTYWADSACTAHIKTMGYTMVMCWKRTISEQVYIPICRADPVSRQSQAQYKIIIIIATSTSSTRTSNATTAKLIRIGNMHYKT